MAVLSRSAAGDVWRVGKALAEDALEFIAPAAAQFHLRAVGVQEHLVAVKERMNLADAAEVHDGGAVDAEEHRGIERLLQIGERLAQQVGPGSAGGNRRRSLMAARERALSLARACA